MGRRLITLLRWTLRRLENAAPSEAVEAHASKAPDYPWYTVVQGDDLEQGDILESCPVFVPPADLDVTINTPNLVFEWQERDLIVMTQSCDLGKGHEGKTEDVLLCAVWKRSELPPSLSKDSEMENARKGRFPALHVLAASALPNFEREVRVVDFKRVYSLPVAFVRKRASGGQRLRLLPPYREHLSQSFARYFMRVGLPIDIPSFTAKKK